MPLHSLLPVFHSCGMLTACMHSWVACCAREGACLACTGCLMAEASRMWCLFLLARASAYLVKAATSNSLQQLLCCSLTQSSQMGVPHLLSTAVG